MPEYQPWQRWSTGSLWKGLLGVCTACQIGVLILAVLHVFFSAPEIKCWMKSSKIDDCGGYDQADHLCPGCSVSPFANSLTNPDSESQGEDARSNVLKAEAKETERGSANRCRMNLEQMAKS